MVLVMIWSPWSAHTPEALLWLQEASDTLALQGSDVRILLATEPSANSAEAANLARRYGNTLPQVPIGSQGLAKARAGNQMPTILFFRRGALVDQRLGAQTPHEMLSWVALVRGKDVSDNLAYSRE
jgi:hypothetical protein